MRPPHAVILILAAALTPAPAAPAADLDEFKVKRQAVFEFAEKPAVTRQGDRVAVAFATRGDCDVTVAVEDATGRIVRHLACGVLGPSAPPPFRKNSRRQRLIWDGKDDRGAYVDDKDSVVVRVSLGLRARFARSLFWSPAKRWSEKAPLVHAAPEGVYVFDHGRGASQLRLFDHKGDYVRTVYPFGAGKIETFKDLHWHKFPQDGRRLPRKRAFLQCTLLSSGTDSDFDGTMGCGKKHSVPDPAKALAVHERRVALANVCLNRFRTDGASLGIDLKGARTSFRVQRGGLRWRGGEEPIDAGPTSMAFSPDGRRLYLTAYAWTQHWGTGGIHTHWLNGVARVDFEGGSPAEVFAGSMKLNDPGGTEPGRFRVPASVTCDSKGRVYVADNFNDRIQVFTGEGKLIKAIDVPKPVRVAVHPKTGRIHVLSWLVRCSWITRKTRREKIDKLAPPARLIVLGPLESPERIAAYGLPTGGATPSHTSEIDTWTDPPTVWLVPALSRQGRRWERAGIRLLKVGKDGLTVARDFARQTVRSIVRAEPPAMLRQRLYVNPANGKAYLAEGQSGVGKSTLSLLEIDPQAGRYREVPLPFDAEDFAFDLEGMIYLRAWRDLARYDPGTWREVPWDYGQHQKATGFSASRGRRAGVVSSVRIPVHRYNHHGGMMVSAKGHLVLAVHGGQEPAADRRDTPKVFEGKKYSFRLFPGRNATGLVLVFDRRGRVIHDDALPGISFVHGVGIDAGDNIYVMSMAHRVLDGKGYYNEATDTLMKFRPGAGRIYSTRAPVKLAKPPDRPPDLLAKGGGRLGRAWVEGAEWFYGGVGYHGRHSRTDGYGCDCANSRFDMDYFGRSFAPEVEHCSVAVLDSAGNLIMRVGTYGNADDGRPINEAGGPPTPHALGGDEVALFYAPYLAVHTDRRLFVADPGNHRIVCVRLDYHTDEKVRLKDVTDRAGGQE